MKCLLFRFLRIFILIFLLSLSITTTAYCQYLTPVIIASVGDFYESEGYSLSLTIGEPVIDSYLGSSDTVLTCGFQQGDHFTPLVMQWTGEIDDDWSKPGNWNFTRVPNGLDDIVIPGTAIHMPVVRMQGHSCRSLEIKQNGSVTIVSGIMIEVKGNVRMESK